MTRTSGSVPDLRSSTRPALPMFGLHRARFGLDHRVGVHPILVDALDVQQHLRQLSHHACQLRQGLAARGDMRGHHQTGQGAIAGRAVVEEDDVPGLLAAEAVLARLHRFQDVAVSDTGLDVAQPFTI